MTRTRFALLLGLTAFVFVPFNAQAGEPRLLTKYGNWDTYMFTEGNDKVCYMASKVPDLKDKKRGVAYAIITHRPSDGTKNVFSYMAGYTYKTGSNVSVDIDGQKFTLFTKDDTAWAMDGETDSKMAKAIREGKTMTIKGTSAKGTSTTDTLSLSGSTSAHDAIGKECN